METEPLTDIGCQLKKARQNAGYTQAQVAEYVRRSRPTIAAWEANQQQPSLHHLARLAALYGVSADSLIGVEAQAPPERTEVRLKRLERQLGTLRDEVYSAVDQLRTDGILPASGVQR